MGNIATIIEYFIPCIKVTPSYDAMMLHLDQAEIEINESTHIRERNKAQMHEIISNAKEALATLRIFARMPSPDVDENTSVNMESLQRTIADAQTLVFERVARVTDLRQVESYTQRLELLQQPRKTLDSSDRLNRAKIVT